jgi:alpha-L-fucosidase 2
MILLRTPVSRRRSVARLTVAGCAAAFAGPLLAQDRPASPPVLWYTQPAKTWKSEALPIGNGALGGMVFGRTDRERIQFNVDSLWEGDETDTGAYQAFGDLFIELGHAGVTNYRRELDIDRAVLTVTYEAGGVRYAREYFCSYPARAMVVRLTAGAPGAYSGRVVLSDMHLGACKAEGQALRSRGTLNNGMIYEARVLLRHEGGSLTPVAEPVKIQDADLLKCMPAKYKGLAKLARVTEIEAAALAFEKADRLTLILAADTDYVPDYRRNWKGDDPAGRLAQRVEAAARAPYDQLIQAHQKDHQTLFRRFALDLGASPAATAGLPTDERLAQYKKRAAPDPAFEALFCQYGRYLMIASSRPDDLPANLQGVWNDTNSPVWRCDYHSNINIQMNYWFTEPMNLPECHRSFVQYVNSLREVRAKRTKLQFGDATPGWTIQTENGIHGGASWRWNIPGSAWYAQHVWEHYAFSLDTEYLRALAYPILKEVSAFWAHRLKARPDGTLVVPDGWSPEHGPQEEGVTYDQALVYDVFTNAIEAADALGTDKEFRDRLAGLRGRLLKPKVGKHGQLQEWAADKDSPTDRHRHLSHLVCLHPGRQVAPLTTPELAAAARRSIELRGEGGREGWSLGWRVCFWARLLDGEAAYKSFALQLGTIIEPNFLDTCVGFFQIDGNCGAPAGVAEMLLQSHLGELHLLPALPKAWPSGRATGLRGRGGYGLDLVWKDGALAQATIRATAGGACRVRCAARIEVASGGQRVEAKQVKPNVCEFPAVPGGVYTIKPR